MKRIVLFLLVTVTATTACTKKIPSEQLISDFATHYETLGDRFAEPLAAISREKRADYITLQLGKELDAKELWTLDFEAGEEAGQAVIAEFKSRTKEPHVAILTACLDDAPACSAVLDVLDAFKQAKIRPATALRAIFYDGCASGTEGLKAVADDFRRANEVTTFDIEISSRDSIPERTFIIEEKLAFADKVVELVPAYLQPIVDVQFEIGDFPRENWPTKIPTYRYRLGADRIADLKAITAFTFLMN